MNPQLASFLALLRRYPLGFTSSLLAILLAVAAWFLWQDRDDQDVILQGRAKEGEAMLALLVGGSTQRQELADVREAARRIEDNLVIADNLADNKWYFYKLEEQTKALLPELNQMNPPTSDSTLFRRVPFSLRVTGNYEQIFKFIVSLETGSRLTNITSFSLSRQSTPGSLVLDLTLDQLGKK